MQLARLAIPDFKVLAGIAAASIDSSQSREHTQDVMAQARAGTLKILMEHSPDLRHRWSHAGAAISMMPTGATTDECARVLRRAGVQKVVVVTVMRG